MNISEAMRRLELNGGRIYRTSVPVSIYWFKDDDPTWEYFLETRITLLHDDLAAIDWQHAKEQPQ